jgi:ribonuclease HI
MQFQLAFDGGGNAQSIPCYAYTITMDDKVVGQGYGVCHDEKPTSNVAEWSGLWHGLMAAWTHIVTVKRYHTITSLVLCGDSQLVLNQLTGNYGVTKPHLRFYHRKCVALVQRIEQEGVPVTTKWAGRETNKVADKLTHRARRLYSGVL